MRGYIMTTECKTTLSTYLIMLNSKRFSAYKTVNYIILHCSMNGPMMMLICPRKRV